MQRINHDYFKIFGEIPLLIKISLIKNKPLKKIKKVLIVNTCLIGDFIVGVPAIREFIQKNKVNADLMVSPSTKAIAEKIKGIGKVFAVKSVYNRDLEKTFKEKEEKFKEYDLILVMRISKESYKLIKQIKFKKIKSYSKQYFSFGFNITKNLSLKRSVKQWRAVNFEMIGQKDHKLPFEKIFDIKKEDYNFIKKLRIGQGKKIIIHTGSGWKVKLLENEKWIEILKKINKVGKFSFIFVGATEEEKKAFEKISKNLDFKIYSLIDKINLLELFLLMKKSDYFIGIDSGPRNMAHMANLRSVNLLGPGPKHFMPLDKRDVIIDKSNCKCTHLFCYKKKTCMQKILAQDVVEAFKKLSRTI